jgi:hypothetical protein
MKMTRSTETETRSTPSSQAGFALVLAMLALMLLTFLGLALTMTTSTELQIATNYRWSQQAYYNAEAGIELGKRYLRQIEWNVVLPTSRSSADMGSAPPWSMSRPGASGEASRNFENAACDTGVSGGNQGFGVVFDNPTFASPFQNTSSFFGQALTGSFTVWVRRPLVWDSGASMYVDNPNNNLLILTAEGTAPYRGASAIAIANRAIRILEVQLQRVDPAECENYTGQAGSGPGGANYDPCSTVKAQGIRSGTAGATTREVSTGVQ